MDLELEQSRGGGHARDLWGPQLFPFHSEALEKIEVVNWEKREEGGGAQWLGLCTLPLPMPMPMPCCFVCSQWSQAAPMAEGEQKPHEGESPWLLDGVPGRQGQVQILLFRPGVGEGCRNMRIKTEVGTMRLALQFLKVPSLFRSALGIRLVAFFFSSF